ncbi:hypothetical protein [Pedobacter jeongneungensis]|uniref:hypothetical protein n=1 Tax=Pedobacter jeongneungensis TaxID=947309 RepID=UPI00046A41A9|nr:hypothetical protein [Pedobacter jeongneungensis]
MWVLPKPTDDAKTVFLDCISIIQDKALKKRLEHSAHDVADAAVRYEAKVASNKLYTLPRNKSTKANKDIRVLGLVTISEMKAVYTNCFALRGTKGRVLYDKILAQPKNSKCPYCFHRQVSTIDHYLSKAYYPLLCVAPVNLIPCCKDCNFTLGSKYPKQAEDELLHPYFDNVENELWLKAKVERTTPVSVSFYVSCPNHWDGLLKDRVKHHFDCLALNSLYSAEAANELTNLNYLLSNLLSTVGRSAVMDILKEMRNSRRSAHVNSWQTAMYTALAKDVWFCEGGFVV